MSLFTFHAQDAKGGEQRGTIEAQKEAAVASVLMERGWKVFSVAPVVKRFRLDTQIEFLSRVRTKELVVFSRQLAVMVTASVPIVQSLRTLIDQTTNVTLRTAISAIADDVESGAKLSQALAEYPKIFSNFYINMVKSGETSGKLDEVLEYLATQQEKDYDFVTKVRGAMMYPAFILGGLIVVAWIMMVYVIPKLTSILTETHTALPLSTRILVGTSDFFVHYWWFIIFLVIAAIIGIRIAIRFPRGHYAWDWFKLSIPIFGSLLQEIILVRFLQSLATLLKGGVPLPKALEIVAEVVNNRVYGALFTTAIAEVRDGHSMASVFRGKPFIPPMVPQMFVVGEHTGALDSILGTLAQFYTRQVDNRVTNLVSLIEPLIIVLMGVGVGIMVTAVLLPIYNLAGSI